MRKTSSIRHMLAGEDGSVILTMVVVLVAVTALGLTMMNLGHSEMEMVVGDKFTEDSFYDADACNVATARYLRLLGILDERGEGTFIQSEDAYYAPGVKYADGTTAQQVGDYLLRAKDIPFLEDVEGEMQFVFSEDLGFIPDRLAAVADVRPQGSISIEGSASNQQNAGYSAGIGLGGAGSGGTADLYIIACEGRGLNAQQVQAVSRTYAMYRRILGSMAGGL